MKVTLGFPPQSPTRERGMSDERYHVFYTQAVGNQSVYETFETGQDVLDFIAMARKNGDESPYRNVRVIFGAEMEFEPVKVVQLWRFKE